MELQDDEEKAGCRQITNKYAHAFALAKSMLPKSRRNKSVLLFAFTSLAYMILISDLLLDTTGLNLQESSLPRILSSQKDHADDVAGDDDGPTFVFIMGIEGTGHHFISELLSHSPNMIKMQELGMCHTVWGERDNEFFKLSTQFLNAGNGLFDPSKRNKNSLDAGTRYDTAVDLLGTIRRKVNIWRQEKQVDNVDTEYHVAINANSCNAPTMMSYPSYIGPDRPLQNLNLDVLYNACADAKVKCKHVYIYRDPYDVIKSTTRNKHYNSNIFDSIRLYTSVLRQIHSHMVSYPERNLGCFGFLDAKGYQIEQDWERFSALWGWDSFEDFMATAKEVNTKSPMSMSKEMKAKLVPSRLSVMMRAFEDVYNRVNDLCYSSLHAMEDQTTPIINPDEVESDEDIPHEAPSLPAAPQTVKAG